MDNVIIKKRTDDISLESLQHLLTTAHQVNEANGLLYATAHQSIERLAQKLKGSTTFVALKDNRLVGTMTIQFREIDHWYHKGTVGLIKLVAVHPSEFGGGISSRLMEECMKFADENKVKVLVTDSAENCIKKIGNEIWL